MVGIILEACVETFEQALAAVENGANRIELCERLDIGGITPSFYLAERLISRIKIPLMVMVRPHGGNFEYKAQEFTLMKNTIRTLKDLGCHGIVLGLLTSEKRIDVDRTGELLELARPLQVTFHKAFDECPNLETAISDLKVTGVDRLLTSGGEKFASHAIKTLNNLSQFALPEIAIIAAGGVTHENISGLKSHLPNINEYHGRKIVPNVSCFPDRTPISKNPFQ